MEKARNDDLEALIATEVEASEATRDQPSQGTGRRRNDTREKVYSVRLTSDQVEKINAIAEQAGIPASGLVRGWVLQGLDAHQAGADSVLPSIDHAMNSLLAVRTALTEHLQDTA